MRAVCKRGAPHGWNSVEIAEQVGVANPDLRPVGMVVAVAPDYTIPLWPPVRMAILWRSAKDMKARMAVVSLVATTQLAFGADRVFERLVFEITPKGEAIARRLEHQNAVKAGAKIEVLLNRKMEYRETVAVFTAKEAVDAVSLMEDVATKFKWQWTGGFSVGNLPAEATTAVALELDQHGKIKRGGQLRVFHPTDRDGVFQNLTSRTFALVALERNRILGIREVMSWGSSQDWNTLTDTKLSENAVRVNLLSRRTRMPNKSE